MSLLRSGPRRCSYCSRNVIALHDGLCGDCWEAEMQWNGRPCPSCGELHMDYIDDSDLCGVCWDMQRGEELREAHEMEKFRDVLIFRK